MESRRGHFWQPSHHHQGRKKIKWKNKNEVPHTDRLHLLRVVTLVLASLLFFFLAGNGVRWSHRCHRGGESWLSERRRQTDPQGRLEAEEGREQKTDPIIVALHRSHRRRWTCIKVFKNASINRYVHWGLMQHFTFPKNAWNNTILRT